MILDLSRHSTVFDPRDVRGGIDVIGVGATGSRIALSLAKLGVPTIRCWDDDVVEAHNIPNQIYGLQDVGTAKVKALARHIESTTGTKIEPMEEKFTGQTQLLPYVFLLTDTMSSRKEVWEKSLQLKPHIEVVIETRMGSRVGRIYAFTPRNFENSKAWVDTLITDDEPTEASVCGTTISVGPTAELVSGFAVWQWMRSLKSGPPELELIFSTDVPSIFTSKK